MAEPGRPSGYESHFAGQATKLCLLGATDDELADFFGVHRATIYRWKHDHQDFCDAIKTGKEFADERVERSLYQKATGYNVTEEQAVKLKVGQFEEQVEVVQVEKHVPADTTAAIFWMKNRRSGAWKDVKATEHTGQGGGPIKFAAIDMTDAPADALRWLATHAVEADTASDATHH